MADDSGLAIFGATGYSTPAFPDGVAKFICEEFAYGTSLLYTEVESKLLKSIYFRNQVFGNFTISLHFTDFDRYRDASNYFVGYIDWLTSDGTQAVQPMACIYPPRNIFMMGVPHDGMSYGTQVGQFTWSLDIEFTGTYQALTESEQDSYQAAPIDQSASQIFYPLGIQTGKPTSTIESAVYGYGQLPLAPADIAATRQ